MAEMRSLRKSIILYTVIGVLAGILLIFGYLSLARPVTTVILVRHAEKKIEPSNPDVTLSPEGEARAQELARVLGASGVTAIYASQYTRTQQTAKPLADRLSLQITKIDSKDSAEVVRQIKSQHAGGVVFLAGHNNTVPAIIGGLGGGTLPTIPEDEYDNMFVVTISGFGRVKVVKFKYGSSAKATGQQMMVQP
jgi:broad specificity phosphatase PhoE